MVGFSITRVEVLDAQRSMDDYRVEALVATCNGWLRAKVAESSDTVEVTVRDFKKLIPILGGEDCQDLLIIELEEPLARRQLIDGSTGDAVPVQDA